MFSHQQPCSNWMDWPQHLQINQHKMLPAHLVLGVHELQALALHHAKHVEEAIVAAGGQALLQAQLLDEVGGNLNNLLWLAPAEALH